MGSHSLHQETEACGRRVAAAPWGCQGPCSCLCLLDLSLRSSPLCLGLFFFTFLFYLVSIAAVVLMFIYYTESGACHEGKVFISLNLTFCVCVSIVAVLPKIQVSLPGGPIPLQVGLCVGSWVLRQGLTVGDRNLGCVYRPPKLLVS